MQSQQVAPTPIIRRNIQFDFQDTLPTHWHSGEPGITAFYDALSLTFPEGERFFIASVRNFASWIDEPGLRRDVSDFAAQEAVHSREHSAYNALIKARGVPVDTFERLMCQGSQFVQRHLPAKALLAATCAYEHYTALFAEQLLGDDGALEGAHPFYRDLWRWHAMEEEEHKAVAFDVYRTVARDPLRYVRRVVAMAVVTLDFSLTTAALILWLMIRRRQALNLPAWSRLFRYLWIAPGIWRHVAAGVFSYMMPGFHPWKRSVSPRVLAWRNYYRSIARPTPGAASIFTVPA